MRGDLPALRTLGRTGSGLLIGGILALSANFMGFIEGLDRTTPANAQLVIQTAPLLLGIGGIVVFGERYSRLQWAGVAVIVVGLALFFSGQLGSTQIDRPTYLMGTGLLLMAGVTWAAYGLAQKQLLHSMGSVPAHVRDLRRLRERAAAVEFARGSRVLVGHRAGCSSPTVRSTRWWATAPSRWRSSTSRHRGSRRSWRSRRWRPWSSRRRAPRSGRRRFPLEELGLAQWLGGAGVVLGSLATTLGAERSRRLAA